MLPQIRQPLTSTCCHGGSAPSSIGLRRGRQIAAGALWLGVWALVPKCPICLAAHVAFWTGLGLSFTAANYLRWSLLIFSGAALFCLAMKRSESRRGRR